MISNGRRYEAHISCSSQPRVKTAKKLQKALGNHYLSKNIQGHTGAKLEFIGVM